RAGLPAGDGVARGNLDGFRDAEGSVPLHGVPVRGRARQWAGAESIDGFRRGRAGSDAEALRDDRIAAVPRSFRNAMMSFASWSDISNDGSFKPTAVMWKKI